MGNPRFNYTDRLDPVAARSTAGIEREPLEEFEREIFDNLDSYETTEFDFKKSDGRTSREVSEV